jgi:hypothetical protein
MVHLMQLHFVNNGISLKLQRRTLTRRSQHGYMDTSASTTGPPSLENLSVLEKASMCAGFNDKLAAIYCRQGTTVR